MQFRWCRFEELRSDELYALLALRQDILVVEQASPYTDLDFIDQTAEHLLVTTGAGLVAYARCRGPSAQQNYASFGRLVIAREYRGRGLGREIVKRILARLADASFTDVRIGAQLHLERFYAQFGFARDGEPYDDVGVMHVDMRLRLPQAAHPHGSLHSVERATSALK
jgi:ElaA protein